MCHSIFHREGPRCVSIVSKTKRSEKQCRRNTAAPNARGRFRRHADWRCTELAGSAQDSALPPDGASSLTKPRQASEETGIGCFDSTSGLGRRVTRVGEPVRLHRVPLHKRRRRRGGHAPSHAYATRSTCGATTAYPGH